STLVGTIVEFEGRADNVLLRQAGMLALAINLLFVLLAIVSITVTVPKGGGSRDLGTVAPSPHPEPQLPPDEQKAALIARLSELSLSELEELEKQIMLRRLSEVDRDVLRQLIESSRQ